MKILCTEAEKEPTPTHKLVLQFVELPNGKRCWRNVCVKCGVQQLIVDKCFVPPVFNIKEVSSLWKEQPAVYTLEGDCITANWLREAYSGRCMTFIEDTRDGYHPYGTMKHHLLVSHSVLCTSNGERVLLCLFRCLQTLELCCAEFGTEINRMDKFFRTCNFYSSTETEAATSVEKLTVTYNDHLTINITLTSKRACEWNFRGDAISLTRIERVY
jgi:hypothetical protein